MQGVVQHEYLALRRRLEADFAFFSACASGSSPSTHLLGSTHVAATDGGKGAGARGAAAYGAGAAAGRRRAFKRLSSIEAHERRFLQDFMQCMHASHFRLLGRDEWDAAAAEVQWGGVGLRARRLPMHAGFDGWDQQHSALHSSRRLPFSAARLLFLHCPGLPVHAAGCGGFLGPGPPHAGALLGGQVIELLAVGIRAGSKQHCFCHRGGQQPHSHAITPLAIPAAHCTKPQAGGASRAARRVGPHPHLLPRL